MNPFWQYFALFFLCLLCCWMFIWLDRLAFETDLLISERNRVWQKIEVEEIDNQ